MPSPLPFAPEAVRALFPAFSTPEHAQWGFFDNAGGSHVAGSVITRITRYYTETKLQPYGPAPASRAAGEAMDLAHARMARALNVPLEAVHFGPSTSANTYTLAKAFGQMLGEGDVVVVTDQDHEANSGAWRGLRERGVELREWRVEPETGHLDSAALAPLLDERVRLVAFPHCSNIVGEINPVAAIADMVHAVGALAVVDGVAAAPHGLPDVTALDADIYLFSAYKTFGPHQGVMVIRPEIAERLPNQSHFFNDDILRKRLVPAGPDHAQIAASAGIVDYLDALADLLADAGSNPYRSVRAAIQAQEAALMAPLLAYFDTRRGLRLLGPRVPAHRAPTFSLALDEPGNDMARRLADHGIIAAGGHFYAWRLLESLGVAPETGVLRLSFLHYTTPGEIEKLIAALEAELP